MEQSTTTSSSSSTNSNTPPKRKLRFAISSPSLRDGFTIFIVGKIAAWVTSVGQGKTYCHIELLFEDNNVFGMTSQGLHFEKRVLTLEEYQFVGLMVDESNYLKLLEFCNSAAHENLYSFSSWKAICRHLPLLNYLIRLWPARYTYCSELILIALHSSGLFLDLPLSEASPNGIANYLAHLMKDYNAFMCCGPDLQARELPSNIV